MNLEEIYILHPAYVLRNDEKRVVLTALEDHLVPVGARNIPYNDGAVFILHPFHAQLLAFFDGERSLNNCIAAIAAHFCMAPADVKPMVEQYIENPETQTNGYIQIPRNLLILKSGFNRLEKYVPEQFILTGDIDLSYGRLYRPLRTTIELTMQCYTDCVYCYADRSRCRNEGLLSVERMKEIIRECRAAGIVDISINGGEVLMYEGFEEVFEELIAQGYNSLISTKKPIDKGTLLFLKEIGMTRIQISLDSVCPETLTRMLRVGPTYLDKIRNTMHLLDDLEFEWSVHTILTRFNANIEKEIKPLADELMQYKHLHSFRIDAAGYSLYKSEENFNAIKASLSDIQKIKEFMGRLAANVKSTAVRMGDAETAANCSAEEKRILFNDRAVCTGNQCAFVVLPDGKVTICEELYWHPKFIIGDLVSQSVLEMWQSEKAKRLFHIPPTKFRKESPCRECKTFDACRGYCGVCWKLIMYAYGDRNWDYPDVRCPVAVKPFREYYLK